jgi:hypothetical protein
MLVGGHIEVRIRAEPTAAPAQTDEEVTMKALAVLAALVALATTLDSARAAQRIPPPDYSKCTNCRTAADQKLFRCLYYYHSRHHLRDPRYLRLRGPSDLHWGNPDAASLVLEARRACGQRP